MTCASSSVKACSLVLLVFSFLMFFNWTYLVIGYEEAFNFQSGFFFEGIWGPLFLLITGALGISLSCGDTPCKRIFLLVCCFINFPILIGVFLPLAVYYVWSEDRHYYYSYTDCLTNQHSYNDISYCLSDYLSCMQDSWTSSYSCSSQFQSCIGYQNYYGYRYDCGGSEMYSVIQMFLNSLAMIFNLVLLISIGKHHNICGPNCCNCDGTTVEASGVVHTQSPGMVQVQVPAHMAQPHAMQGQQQIPGFAPPAYGLVHGGAPYSSQEAPLVATTYPTPKQGEENNGLVTE